MGGRDRRVCGGGPAGLTRHHRRGRRHANEEGTDPTSLGKPLPVQGPSPPSKDNPGLLVPTPQRAFSGGGRLPGTCGSRILLDTQDSLDVGLCPPHGKTMTLCVCVCVPGGGIFFTFPSCPLRLRALSVHVREMEAHGGGLSTHAKALEMRQVKHVGNSAFKFT